MAYKKNNPVTVEGLRVEVKNGNFDRALRVFSKKVQSSGILKELRRKEFYEKPTSVRRRAGQTAKKREQRRVSEDTGVTTPREY